MKLAVLHKVARVIGKHLPLPLVIVLLVLTLTGVSIPKDYELYKKVGFFVIRPYKYGLYLTQQNSKIFYNVSPYQFYYQGGDGTKENLLKWQYEVHSKEIQLTRSQKLIYSTLSYLKLVEPSASFKYDKATLKLASRSSGSKLVFTLAENTFTPANSRTLYLTISFNPEDVIFDDTQNVFTETAQEDLAELNKTLQLSLKPSETSFSAQPQNGNVTILNPELNGYMHLPTATTNQSLEKIDLENKLLEFKLTSYGNSAPALEIYTGDTANLSK